MIPWLLFVHLATHSVQKYNFQIAIITYNLAYIIIPGLGSPKPDIISPLPQTKSI